MDFQGAFTFQLTLIAIVLMAAGAFAFWVLTTVFPYVWNHLHWVN